MFLGFGMGGGGIKASQTIYNEDGRETWAMQNTLDWGIMGGYKHFFTQNFGARFYASFIISHASMAGAQRDNIGYTISTFLINYTANADLLYNFYQNTNIELGGFVGLGLGGSSYYVINSESLYNLAQHAFDIGIDFGLRTQFSHNHGIELVARVPFLPLVKARNTTTETSVRQAFSLMLRYAYTFGSAPKSAQISIKKRIKTTRQRQIRQEAMD